MKTILRGDELSCPSCISKIESHKKPCRACARRRCISTPGASTSSMSPRRRCQLLQETVRKIGYGSRISAFLNRRPVAVGRVRATAPSVCIQRVHHVNSHSVSRLQTLRVIASGARPFLTLVSGTLGLGGVLSAFLDGPAALTATLWIAAASSPAPTSRCAPGTTCARAVPTSSCW